MTSLLLLQDRWFLEGVESLNTNIVFFPSFVCGRGVCAGGGPRTTVLSWSPSVMWAL